MAMLRIKKVVRVNTHSQGTIRKVVRANTQFSVNCVQAAFLDKTHCFYSVYRSVVVLANTHFLVGYVDLHIRGGYVDLHILWVT